MTSTLKALVRHMLQRVKDKPSEDSGPATSVKLLGVQWSGTCWEIPFKAKDISLNLASDQIRSVTQSCPTLCDPMNHSTPGLRVHHQLLQFTQSMSIESVMPSNHLTLCGPLFLQPSIFPNIRVFSNESALRIRWPKCWSFSFNISPSNEHPGLISFRMDWLDLVVQGTLKSLLQHHSSKASVFLRWAWDTGHSQQ